MNGVFLFVISLIIGFIPVLFFVRLSSKASKNFHTSNSEKSSIFSLENPPNQSLRGDISSVVGDVQWQSRLATEPALLAENRKVQQGESLITGEDGSLTVDFENGGHIAVSADSNLDFVQTLPEHIVVIQRAGTAKYVTEKDSLISVRSMHLVADLAKESEVSIEKDAELLTFIVDKGSVQVAFNSLENETTTMNVGEGETYVYDDESRSGEFE